MGTPTLAGPLDQLAVALLVVVLIQVTLRSLQSAIAMVFLQGVLLVATALVVATSTERPDVYVGVAIIALSKVVLLPALLMLSWRTLPVKVETRPLLSTRAMFVASVGLTLVAYDAAGALALPGAMPSRQALPVALSLMLIGLFSMIVRRKALGQVMGLVTLDNGIALASLVATAGLPLAVELGVAFDVLIGVAVMGVVVGRIGQAFQSTDIDYLRGLRG